MMSEPKNPKYKLQWKLSELKRLQNNQSMLQSEIDTVRSEIKKLRPFTLGRFLCSFKR